MTCNIVLRPDGLCCVQIANVLFAIQDIEIWIYYDCETTSSPSSSHMCCSIFPLYLSNDTNFYFLRSEQSQLDASVYDLKHEAFW